MTPIVRPPWVTHPDIGRGDVLGGQQQAPPPSTGGTLRDALEALPGRLSERDRRLSALMTYLSEIEHGRQALVDALWSRLPVYVDEYGGDQTGTVTSITVAPQTRNLERITAVIAIVPAGAVGTLTLGRRVFTLPAGTTSWGSLGFLLQASDFRKLTSTIAGNLSLALHGEQVPLYGRVS